MPIPMVAPSSTRANVKSTAECGGSAEVVFQPLESHFDPISNQYMKRELQESNPFIVPRKLEQVLV